MPQHQATETSLQRSSQEQHRFDLAQPAWKTEQQPTQLAVPKSRLPVLTLPGITTLTSVEEEDARVVVEHHPRAWSLVDRQRHARLPHRSQQMQRVTQLMPWMRNPLLRVPIGTDSGTITLRTSGEPGSLSRSTAAQLCEWQHDFWVTFAIQLVSSIE